MKTVVIDLEVQTCGACGVVFGMESEHRRKLMETHGTFYCPNGHRRKFIGKTEAEKLRDEVTRKQAALDQAWALIAEQRRSAAAVKGVLTKVKKRISGGVCPCCNRYFKALHRHMTTQHPEASQVDE